MRCWRTIWSLSGPPPATGAPRNSGPLLVNFAKMTRNAQVVELVVQGDRAAMLYTCDCRHRSARCGSRRSSGSRSEKSAPTKPSSTPRNCASSWRAPPAVSCHGLEEEFTRSGGSLRRACGRTGGCAEDHVRLSGLSAARRALRFAARGPGGPAPVAEGCGKVDLRRRARLRTDQRPTEAGPHRRSQDHRGQRAVAQGLDTPGGSLHRLALTRSAAYFGGALKNGTCSCGNRTGSTTFLS